MIRSLATSRVGLGALAAASTVALAAPAANANPLATDVVCK
jgi:hypothetical protein